MSINREKVSLKQQKSPIISSHRLEDLTTFHPPVVAVLVLARETTQPRPLCGLFLLKQKHFPLQLANSAK